MMGETVNVALDETLALVLGNLGNVEFLSMNGVKGGLTCASPSHLDAPRWITRDILDTEVFQPEQVRHGQNRQFVGRVGPPKPERRHSILGNRFAHAVVMVSGKQAHRGFGRYGPLFGQEAVRSIEGRLGRQHELGEHQELARPLWEVDEVTQVDDGVGFGVPQDLEGDKHRILVVHRNQITRIEASEPDLRVGQNHRCLGCLCSRIPFDGPDNGWGGRLNDRPLGARLPLRTENDAVHVDGLSIPVLIFIKTLVEIDSRDLAYVIGINL
jgi:hypothetical protein